MRDCKPYVEFYNSWQHYMSHELSLFIQLFFYMYFRTTSDEFCFEVEVKSPGKYGFSVTNCFCLARITLKRAG